MSPPSVTTGTQGVNERVASAWQGRHTLVVLCFLAAFICYIDRVNISVAALAMQEHFGWSDSLKGLVLSSFFVGYLLLQLPSGWLVTRYGGRLVLAGSLVWWSIFTALTPLLASLSITALLAGRIALGAGEAAAFPAAYHLLARWALPGERTRFVGTLISGVPAGTLFALVVTGWQVTRFGWESPFYTFGFAGILFATVWLWWVRDDPRSHPSLSPVERERYGTHEVSGPEQKQVPWRALLAQPAVWALIVNHFCTNWTLYVLLSWLPSFFRTTFQTSIFDAGLFSAAPWLSMFVMIHVSAWLSDALIARGVRATLVRKLMQTVGLLGASGFVLLALSAASAVSGLVFMCFALGASGFTQSGFACNHLDIAPRYAGALFSVTNTVGTIPGIAGVAITGFLVDATGSFRTPLALAAALNIGAVAVWLRWARAERLVD